ncbi:MAG: hypothetical protein J3K34DRAFT_520489 [Monoraphidium minutum]|nr:MAG: hypothetical protein J3K34DRAFT_520489 [Monoraphidium minutum]
MAPPRCTRRRALALPPLLAGGAAAAVGVAAQLAAAAPAAASKLGGAVDSAWEALGGGPPDLFFPDTFLGTWDVVSTLVKVETPLGEEKLPNPAVVQRAREADLGQPNGYQVSFVRNGSGRVIFDRRFNMTAMMAQYYPGSNVDFAGRIQWNPDDPNILQLRMPAGGPDVRTRVTRRSEVDKREASRIETSEFLEQVFESAGSTRVKASQCFTKYLYRDEAAAATDGGPAIVATQVVSDYLTPYDGEAAYLAARNQPVAVYTYKMAFTRHACAGANCAALVAS